MSFEKLKALLKAQMEAGFELSLDERISQVNQLREIIHKASPFNKQPVDFVKWVPSSQVSANDYNPNSVAPPEMELLRTSIRADGYTQPIVGNDEGEGIVVVDGFHRHRVGKECADINQLIHDYLPVVQIRAEQVDKSHRMASTVRHNRARGKHKVEAMSDMVIELKRRNWSNAKICKELGMDQDEVLRLCQISGLADIFSGQEFSKSWEPQGHVTPDDLIEISGNAGDYEDDGSIRTANTSDEDRIFHTHDKWECHTAGFYETRPPKGMNADICRAHYCELLSDANEFARVLEKVTSEWHHSCEHYLTNAAMNRIAWLGQAALCYKYGIPAEFRGGYGLLTKEQQDTANSVALDALNAWLVENGRQPIPMEVACPDRQSDIY